LTSSPVRRIVSTPDHSVADHNAADHSEGGGFDMRTIPTLIVAASLIAVSATAQADKISDAIREGQRLYDDGKLSKAVKELQYAISRIGRRVAAAYEETLPPPPDGWRASKAKSSSAQALGMFTGTTVRRTYRQDGGRGRITAELVVDNPMVQAFVAMFTNPQMAATAGYDRARIKDLREEALVKYDADTRRGEMILLIGGRVFIKLTGRRIDSDDVLRGLLEAWDYDKLRAVAGLD
jgi:hypothetical protein